MDKKKLRQHLLNLRQSLSLKEVKSKSNKITSHILKNFSLIKNSKIFLYVPIRNEVDTWPLIFYCWENHIKTYFPKCEQVPGKMYFYLVQQKSELSPGKFGILEPSKKCPIFSGTPPQIIFLPGVGFDLRKYRLGYGGGYYDRFLNKPIFQKSILVGLAFNFQIVKSLPIEEWDKKMHFIVTENKIF